MSSKSNPSNEGLSLSRSATPEQDDVACRVRVITNTLKYISVLAEREEYTEMKAAWNAIVGLADVGSRQAERAVK